MLNLWTVTTTFVGAIIGSMVYSWYFDSDTPSIDQLEKETLAYSQTLAAVDDVVDDEQRKEITERANERLEEYETDVPVRVKNSNTGDGE